MNVKNTIEPTQRLGAAKLQPNWAKCLECVQLAGAVVRRGVIRKREQAPRTPNASRGSMRNLAQRARFSDVALQRSGDTRNLFLTVHRSHRTPFGILPSAFCLLPFLLVIFVMLALCAGCKGTRTEGEKEARRQVQAVAGGYRPEGRKPELPALTASSSLGDFLTYALRNQPQVEAAYYDWLASVEGI